MRSIGKAAPATRTPRPGPRRLGPSSCESGGGRNKARPELRGAFDPPPAAAGTRGAGGAGGPPKPRDSELPDQPASTRAPLILLSGFSTVATSATVRAIRSTGLRGGSDGSQQPMFAVAVPNALDKPLTVLIEELEGDHMANQQKEVRE